MLPNFDEIKDIVSNVSYNSGNYEDDDKYISIMIHYKGSTKPITLYVESECCEKVWLSTELHIPNNHTIRFPISHCNNFEKIVGKRIKNISRSNQMYAYRDTDTDDSIDDSMDDNCNDYPVYPISITLTDDTIVYLWMHVDGNYSGIFKMEQCT